MAYIANLKVTDVATEYGGRWDANDEIILHDGSKLSLADKPHLVTQIEGYLNAEHNGRAFIDYRPNCGQTLFTSARTMLNITKRNIRLRIGQAASSIDSSEYSGSD